MITNKLQRRGNVCSLHHLTCPPPLRYRNASRALMEVLLHLSRVSKSGQVLYNTYPYTVAAACHIYIYIYIVYTELLPSSWLPDVARAGRETTKQNDGMYTSSGVYWNVNP